MNKKEIIAKSLTIGQELLGVNEAHRAIISEFYANGFNKRAAVSSVNPELSANSAKVTAHYIFTHPDNQSYIKDKQRELKESTGIQSINIVRELINWAFSDATVLVGLTKDEVKELPPDVKRSIQSIRIKNKSYYDKELKTMVTIEDIECKMIDKTKPMESLSKWLGLYSEDNKQKGLNVNILQVLQDSNPDILNGLLQAMQKNTIDE